MSSTAKNAVVLLSGGLDSTTVAAVVKAQGFRIHALSFDYGQRHHFELQAAARVASWVGAIRHETVQLDLRMFGGSALTADIDVPKSDELVSCEGIPVTYVPARNTIFLSFALAWAEVLGSRDIFIGVNALDYSGYPDCRPEFIAAYQRMAGLATRAGVEQGDAVTIHTPLIDLTKAQIVQLGLRHAVDYSMTSSCYEPDAAGRPCGRCDSCHLRRKGFSEAGSEDPLVYIEESAS
jgi:7-cyano-7-deazaguanine synthase